ncbi:circularly permuted type 2 ATP-grasp protein [Nitrogeniibacter mangrovi]|uniref:Circularly permuted type 2 ATP-grasp protein n=1 Tax=Nitrogeniibacter mangrovi TaxID=2016596 RepID=A0A6C1B509_9RHOO|nr:circularly permuted type 2 ATP-grasp protein [Nitrogeniibacter mangrovi]QID18089.1 circularly permuted type 2 ATP-grasp protein [Nitrogeniibacter mangrovi]
MVRTLLSIYSHPPNRFDEMMVGDGLIRPHWRELFEHLDGSSPEAMRQRIDFAERSILEDGVAYNVYGDPDGQDRPWALDPLPFILSAEEWHTLEAGIAQRARVLNAMLADLYGEQRLLSQGLLPPALVFGQHGFLWPCVGTQPPGGVFLHQYAVDLARSPDGQWWVIADRTQTPTGSGYALENRLIVSRVFPRLFRDMRIERLAGFYAALQSSLERLAPVENGERPRVVVLTPGPYNATYFEHAYLSRYLGFPLVEGQDLTVRGDTVYLKTLSGLQRVHAIMRRVNDDFCDPLELRGESALGVPGLMNVVRAGRVFISNALGSGLPGSSAVMGFLPALARELLGETLSLPSVATWWCGEEPAMDYALEHLDGLVIKPAYPTQRLEPVFGHTLRGAERAEMISRIRARPHAYVAQEWVRLSQTPVWSRAHERRLLARNVGLRMYAVATPDGYKVMPGGLARVAGSSNALVLSMQRGGTAKDIWVRAEGAVDPFSLLKKSVSVSDLVRSGSNLSSRVVENLFWLARYSERLDVTARLLRVAIAQHIDNAGELTPPLEALLTVAERTRILGPVDPEAPAVSLESRLCAAVQDPGAENSISDACRRLLWAASQVRERLSLDHWHSLNRLQRDLQGMRTGGTELGDMGMLLDMVLQVSSSLTGFSLDNMTRDTGWRFHVLGRRIERLAFLCDAIGGFLTLHFERDSDNLEWLLQVTDSIITYRSRYARSPEILSVIDLSVMDESNPHGVAFQIVELIAELSALDAELGELPVEPIRRAGQAVRAFDLHRFEQRPRQAATQLAESLSALLAEAHALSDKIAMRFFTHVDSVSHLTLAS